ncbi:MAG: Nucleotidyl transferase [Acidobacteriales bacterium]|nr:Nucleotidyl transferase [Terriglobales bacterium]
MKLVILAGGFGSRLSEETAVKPKPMVEIGGKPILWHIMKFYSSFGINDFIICLGYKGYVIKEYFANYYMHSSDVTFDMSNNTTKVHQNSSEPWRVTLVDTGENTMTGGRLRRVKPYLESAEPFCFTYGDGVANVNISKLVEFHLEQKTYVTLTATQPSGKFGALKMDATKVISFHEKPSGDGRWVNGGFFVLSPKVLDYIEGDESIWEREPMERLSEEGQVSAFRHSGFWQPMDTVHDKKFLNDLWNTGQAPWKVW